jgi:hypothetical protein
MDCGPTRNVGAKQGHCLPFSARVHVLYKRPEIPANKVVPAIAVSVTYRKQEKAENPGFDSRRRYQVFLNQ